MTKLITDEDLTNLINQTKDNFLDKLKNKCQEGYKNSEEAKFWEYEIPVMYHYMQEMKLPFSEYLYEPEGFFHNNKKWTS